MNKGLNERREANSAEAWVLIILMIIIISCPIIILGTDPHIPLFFVVVVCVLFAMYLKYPWNEIENAMLEGLKTGLPPILILLLIGTVIAGWIASGIVPYIIFWGLKLFTPDLLVVSAFILCSIMSLFIGSSWTVAGTIGIAFMGIGTGMEINPGLTAGAVISGAYLGDKMSPLSETTNFYSSIIGVKLHDHIRSMLYTTIPAATIALVLFAILGSMNHSDNPDTSNVNLIITTLEDSFNFNPLLIIPLIVLIIMLIKKIPALISMAIATILGVIFAIIFQGTSLVDIINYLQDGYIGTTGIENVDEILSNGGLTSMLWTVSLLFLAMPIGGILLKIGALQAVLQKLTNAKTNFGLVSGTLISNLIGCFLLVAFYLPGYLVGMAFSSSYDKKGIDRMVLSRSLEDTGTLVNPIVPWGLSGLFLSSTLGVPTLSYLPYYFLGIFTPFIAILLAATGFGIISVKKKPKEL